jgi:hypothetical protein
MGFSMSVAPITGTSADHRSAGIVEMLDPSSGVTEVLVGPRHPMAGPLRSRLRALRETFNRGHGQEGRRRSGLARQAEPGHLRFAGGPTVVAQAGLHTRPWVGGEETLRGSFTVCRSFRCRLAGSTRTH